jgi:transposase-like protein
MARPTKLTPEVEAALLDAIDAGVSYALAARSAGIAESTLDTWRRRGERLPSSPHGAFLTRLKRAEALAAVRWCRRLDGLPTNWQAMAWKLERRHPDDFGQKKDDTAEKVLRMLAHGNPT